MESLQFFQSQSFIKALKQFFEMLKVPISYFDEKPVRPHEILGDKYNSKNKSHALIDDVYVVGVVNEAAFTNEKSDLNTKDAVKQLKEDYYGLLVVGVELKGNSLTRSALSDITRAFNRAFPYLPVTLVFRYGDFLSISNAERLSYIQQWREGEKVGKVTLLKDINTGTPHAAHLRIVKSLRIDSVRTNSFGILYKYWQSVFSLQALNNEFYADLQEWFNYATQHIKLPFKPDYIPKEENIKNFLVRLLSRTMFCWFVKEKGLIKPELLELKNWDGKRYPLTVDNDDKKFLQSNSYYRGVMQNIFFNALNKKEKSSKKDLKWTKYLHPDFKTEWLINIPYLNGGIFDELLEDNAKESIEDGAIKVPNFLFYGIEEKTKVTKGRGAKAIEVYETIEHKGLNGIFKSYKFTLEENTPYEEDIALDPELLGMVFENLLAELDPNLEETTIKSIRKLTGSYYTPRQVIQEMINESLFLYLKKHIEAKDLDKLKALVYQDIMTDRDQKFCNAVVKAIDQYRVLDPACGSGAFPMGMLHRLVELLKKTDPDNTLWLKSKLQPLDPAYRNEFEKTLKQHLDDYSRKLGIIRDSIYGIDIQPLAVQITKLRFFISLLIDQKVDKGITPMPNIETKIICADTLKTLKPNLWAGDAIAKLETARIKYYQPDITTKEREEVTTEIVDLLDEAFADFSYRITGKKVTGQNKELIKHWFTHATIAAPFFNMDFFYPELKGKGFDCVIGNPPYGGTKVDDEVRIALDIDSKDPYGAFIARFLSTGQRETPLKHGGVLAFIVSDTFMTIKSHFKLRRQMMDNYIHKMIRVHPDTFRATVNTAVIICERNVFPKNKDNHSVFTFDESHVCQMVDMTKINILIDHNRFSELLRKTEGVDFNTESDLPKSISNPLYAIYYYPQSLIRTNGNLPFFMASPKLSILISDSGEDIKAGLKKIGQKEVGVKTVKINGAEVELAKLGEIADVKQGLATGDNKHYLYQNAEVRGNYKSIEPYSEYLLRDEDLERIRNNEKLRAKIIAKGISKTAKNSDTYMDGRFIVPFDKGGESDSQEGFMPNYFVPSNYFIDWSEHAVKRLYSYTIAQRMKDNKEKGTMLQHYNSSPCAVIRNPQFYFAPGITFSPTGVYAPSFRIGTCAIFGNKGSTIFSDIEWLFLLGILSSRLVKFIIKNFQAHTVENPEGQLISVPVLTEVNNRICRIVETIIKKQRKDPRYDYGNNEQIEIDKLVYNLYGLNADDVKEVEDWYVRRYPKLSAAQKANLRKLGKSDDYLVLYGLKEEAIEV